MDDLAALKLQIAWGADEALDEAPVDRMAAPPAVARPVPVASRPAPAVARPGAAALAQAVAANAPNIDALRVALAGFTDCALATTATNLVFADGNPAAGLVLIGEAPGAEEDLAGRPFVGPPGQLLDRMLASIGLDRAQLLITNLIPWRPPGNRPATETEVQICLPFLHRHLALLRPRLLVTLGALPVRALTGRDDGIRKLRGRWQDVTISGIEETIPTLPMLHPAYLMRTPVAKREAWTDLLTLRKRLDSIR